MKRMGKKIQCQLLLQDVPSSCMTLLAPIRRPKKSGVLKMTVPLSV